MPAANFNLSNGTINNVSSGNTASITSYPNGWYRCCLVVPCNSSGSQPVSFYPTQDTGLSLSSNGDGSSGIFLWGAQLEAGSCPSSYIPTTSATVTRSADNCTILINSIPGWNTKSGTIVIYDTWFGGATDSNIWTQLLSDPYNYRIGVGFPSERNITFSVMTGGTYSYYVQDGSITYGIEYKLGWFWSQTAVGMAQNGTVLTSGTGSYIIPGQDLLSLSGYVEPTRGVRCLARLTMYPDAVSTSDLQSLTA